MTTPGVPRRPDIRASRLRPVPRDACSAEWDVGRLPVWGTAARARFWLALEQPGPWGHQAFASSYLDPELGTAIESAVAQAGGRALLIRRPGRSGDARVRRPRQVFVAAGAGAGLPTLLAGRVEDPRDLLDVPWRAMADGASPAPLESRLGLLSHPASVLLLCTNAKRDMCCALRGIPLAATLAARHGERVWECSHTGGHRFAPTGVLLPTGATLGRLDAAIGEAALAAPAQDLAPELLDPQALRGLAHLSPLDQAVDAWARIRWDITDLRPIRVRWDPAPDGASPDSPDARVAEVESGSRTARVAVTEQLDATARHASCGRDPGPATSLQVTELP